MKGKTLNNRMQEAYCSKTIFMQKQVHCQSLSNSIFFLNIFFPSYATYFIVEAFIWMSIACDLAEETCLVDPFSFLSEV